MIVSAYDADRFLERNIHSILDQDYEHFRVIYVDDGSKQANYDKACEIIKNSPIRNKFNILRNDYRKGEVENIYHAIQIRSYFDATFHHGNELHNLMLFALLN